MEVGGGARAGVDNAASHVASAHGELYAFGKLIICEKQLRRRNISSAVRGQGGGVGRAAHAASRPAASKGAARSL